MSNEEMSQKLEELASNESFIEALKKAENKDDIRKTFSAFGVDMTDEEVDSFMAEAEKMFENDEISEEGLEQVSGGLLFGGIRIRVILKIVYETIKKVHRRPLIK